MTKKVLTTVSVVLILLITHVLNPLPLLIETKLFNSNFVTRKLTSDSFTTQNINILSVDEISLKGNTNSNDPQILIDLNDKLKNIYIIKFRSLNKNLEDPWQLYFDRGQGFSERESIKISANGNSEIYLPPYIGTEFIKKIRIDPGNKNNTYFEISHVEIIGE
ncbi:hypothetical protein [Paenibacillus peoriae]|uniref:hypothetical protein n=1 Tax=Paenibacillus peoriae TaxID=59893 RepID=UPI00096DAC63|nr:hypothetical protein [Paenibacillus peoriae]OMF36037.1 hypothetical protein BK134_00080 [Paenibacillus peoriae]